MTGRKRLGVVAATWVLGTGLTLLAPGCYGRNCEGDVVRFTSGPGTTSRMVDENEWESNPVDGEWLPFPRQRAYVFDVPELGGRTPYLTVPFVSASRNPVREGQNFTMGGGNLTEMLFPRPNGVDVRNGTCSDYFLRLVLFAPPDPSAPAPDAAAAEDAGATDASSDASDETDASDASNDAPDGD